MPVFVHVKSKTMGYWTGMPVFKSRRQPRMELPLAPNNHGQWDGHRVAYPVLINMVIQMPIMRIGDMMQNDFGGIELIWFGGIGGRFLG